MDERYYPGPELEVMQAAVNYCTWITDEIRPYVQGRCLEVGAGCGTLSRFLLRTNVQSLFCLEPAANLIAQLQIAVQCAQKPVEVINATLEEFTAATNERFESLVCINVLEHIPDDQRALQQLVELLHPNGYLCVYVPALPQLFGSMDTTFGHQRRYTRERLKVLVHRAGLRIEKLYFLNSVGVVAWWLLGKIFRQRTVTLAQVQRYDRLLIPLIRRLERIISPPIGQNLLLVAQQTRGES